jgi:hypothetical protein
MNTFQLLQLLAAPSVAVSYDNGAGNSNDAYVPEHWAMESLMILEESMVVSKLVHRDFNSQVQSFGDIVNTRRPAKFYSSRKIDTDDVTEQDAISTNVQVPLDQHHYTSFIIKDGEASKSFKDLVSTYLTPAIQAVGRGVDRSVSGQAHRFINEAQVGKLDGLTSSNFRSQLVEANETLNMANVPEDMRRLVLSPTSESAMLNTDLFVKVNEAADTRALRDAQISRLFNFDIFRARNTPCVSDTATDVVSGTITDIEAAGEAPATQACTITGYEVVLGEFATVEGNQQPRFITAATVSTNTTAITLDVANKYATAALAPVKVYQSCLVDLTAGYAIGWSKEINLDAFTNAPQAGQMIAFGVSTARRIYTIIESRANGADQYVLLDRPLEVALVNDQAAFPGPAGCFNMAFHRDALAFVNRPLALPANALGASSAVASYNDLSIRVVMQYDSKKQGTRVTCDLLSGVALLDAEMATLFLG